MNKLFTLTATAVLALPLILTGCGGGDGASSSSASSSAQTSAKAENVELNVSAAASLTNAMQDIAKDYEAAHPGTKLVFNFGSSGALEQAIEHGGAADVFVSAGQKQMNDLEKVGEVMDGTRIDLLRNEVVVIVPKEDGKDINSFDALATAPVEHIALGDPKGVPVGQYSEQIIQKLGIEEAVKAKAVYASDVRQVLSWVETGNADCGIVYATDAAISDKVRVTAKAPADSHKPIIYPAAVVKSSKQEAAAKEFLAYLQSDKGQAVFAKYGFDKP